MIDESTVNFSLKFNGEGNQGFKPSQKNPYITSGLQNKHKDSESTLGGLKYSRDETVDYETNGCSFKVDSLYSSQRVGS